MKQIKFMLVAIVLINSSIKSHQDEQQTLSIPGNITIFDLAHVRNWLSSMVCLMLDKLRHVDTRTFARLHSLQELWLQVNNIDTIFSPFVHVKSVAIDNDDLETIEPNCFLSN